MEGVDEIPDSLEPSAEEMRRVRLQRFGLATSGSDNVNREGELLETYPEVKCRNELNYI
eukprot:COSAG02_NODE_2295_length_9197_cov_20.855463_1_plen_59_part_00